MYDVIARVVINYVLLLAGLVEINEILNGKCSR